MQGRDGGADIEKRRANTVVEGEGARTERAALRHTHYPMQNTSREAAEKHGSSTQRPGTTQRPGREVQEGGDACSHG